MKGRGNAPTRKEIKTVNNNLTALFIGILGCAIYESCKFLLLRFVKSKVSFITVDTRKYNIKSIRLEFYIGFALGIAFTLIKETQNELFNQAISVLTFFSFSVALMGFMCFDDIIKNFVKD